MRLPTLVAGNQPFETGRGTTPNPAIDTSGAEGVARFGGALTALGGVLQERRQRMEDFGAEADWLRFSGAQNQRILDESQNLAPGGIGFAETQRTRFSEEATEYINTRVPERLRPEFFNRLLTMQNTITDQAARIEYAEGIRYQTNEVNTAGTAIEQGVMMSPREVRAAKEAIDALIDQTTLPPIERENLRQAWHAQLVEASIMGLIRENPEDAFIELGGTAPQGNLALGLAPPYRTAALEAAAATGINPNYLAMTAGAEGAVNPYALPRTSVQPSGETVSYGGVRSQYYSAEQFASRNNDGSRPLEIDPAAVAALDNMTTMLGGIPLTINSAYRDSTHNAEVSGAGNSQHLHGTAFDIQLPMNPDERRRILSAAMAAGFTGFGFYADNPNMLHIDIRGEVTSWFYGQTAREVPEWAEQPWNEFIRTRGAVDQVPVNPTTSSATGPYGFIDETWLRLLNTNAGKYDLTVEGLTDAEKLELRNDPRVSTLMAAEYAAENRATMETALGRNVSMSELYLGHFMGGQGAVDLIRAVQADPDAIAATTFEAAATANRSVFYDGDRPRTNREVYNEVNRRFEAQGAANQVPQGRVSPNYSSVPASRLVQFQAQAEAGINDRIVQQQQQEAHRQQVAAADYSRRTSGVERRIYEDPTFGHADLRAEGLQDDDYVRLAKQIDARDAGTANLTRALERYRNGGTWTPFNEDDRRDADLIWGAFDPEQNALATMTPAGADGLMEIIRNTGIVPESAMQQLMGMTRVDDPAGLAYALTLASRINEDAPDAFHSAGISDAFRADMYRWESLTQNQGFSYEDAAARMLEERGPIAAERIATLRTMSDDFVATLDVNQIVQFFDNRYGNVGGVPNAGFTPEGEAALLAEYQVFAREAYIHEANGDAEVAKRLAMAHMDQLYGVTRMFGEPTIMRHPPDRIYGEIGGTMDWFVQQLHAEAEAYLGVPVDRNNLVVYTYPETDRDVQAREDDPGVAPRYAVGVTVERDGHQIFEWLPAAFIPNQGYAQNVQDIAEQGAFIRTQITAAADEPARNLGTPWATGMNRPAVSPVGPLNYVPYELQARRNQALGLPAPGTPSGEGRFVDQNPPLHIPSNVPPVLTTQGWRGLQPGPAERETEPADQTVLIGPAAIEAQRGDRVITDPNQIPAVDLPAAYPGIVQPVEPVDDGPVADPELPVFPPEPAEEPAAPEIAPDDAPEELVRPGIDNLGAMTRADVDRAMAFIRANNEGGRNNLAELKRQLAEHFQVTEADVQAFIDRIYN